MTITDLYLMCTNIEPESRIVVFKNVDDFTFDVMPIYDGDYEKMEPAMAFHTVCRFYVKNSTLYVALEVSDDDE